MTGLLAAPPPENREQKEILRLLAFYIHLRMEGASMHRLTKTDEGIHLEIDYPFTFQERLIYACQTIYNEVVSKSLSGVRPGVEELVKVGMTNFFYC